MNLLLGSPHVVTSFDLAKIKEICKAHLEKGDPVADVKQMAAPCHK